MNKTIGLQDLVDDTRVNDPHVVILGAGASRAAFLQGDRNNKQLPLMCDFVETLGLKPIIEKHEVKLNSNNNFESFFSDLSLEDNKTLIEELEKEIYNYFSDLVLPEHPTLYDHLILSLREKDVIATFNWDPLLWQAGKRIYDRITCKLPKIFFLHGNVAICIDSNRKCKIDISEYIHGKYELCRLLYPIKQKKYNENNFIQAEWGATKNYLSKASMLTIFGYSAPEIDGEAVALLQEGWGNGNERLLEQIELIDIKSESELSETWSSFIHSHHYDVYDNFYRSCIAKYPRRSCEAISRQNLHCEFLDGGTENINNNSPWKMNFCDLERWFASLI